MINFLLLLQHLKTWRLLPKLPYSSRGPLCSDLLPIFYIALPRLVISRPMPDVVNIPKCTVRTVFWFTVISTNLPCILSIISGAIHKWIFNLVCYSLIILCTLLVLTKTAKVTITCNIIFYCFIQNYLSRQEDISLLAVDH